MIVARSINELDLPRHGVVGLVPTMGALHAGHTALFRAARTECDVLVASVFVNPVQFSNGNALAAYPRAFERDAVAQHRRELLVEEGKFVVFHKPKTRLNSASFVTPWFTSKRAEASSVCTGASADNSCRRICSRIFSSTRSHSTSGTRP